MDSNLDVHRATRPLRTPLGVGANLTDITPMRPADCNPSHFAQMVSHLLRNAITQGAAYYSASGFAKGQADELDVADGSGDIRPPEATDRMFKAAVRQESALTWRQQANIGAVQSLRPSPTHL